MDSYRQISRIFFFTVIPVIVSSGGDDLAVEIGQADFIVIDQIQFPTPLRASASTV